MAKHCQVIIVSELWGGAYPVMIYVLNTLFQSIKRKTTSYNPSELALSRKPQVKVFKKCRVMEQTTLIVDDELGLLTLL